VGVFALILCAISISLSNMIGGEMVATNKDLGEPTIAGWIPVVIAVFTPLLFVSAGITAKHLCVQKGFDAFKL
jgi:hypothetical protein